jgi:ketosteroid isomerase-like protein
MQTIRFFALSLGVALGILPSGPASAAADSPRDQVWAAEVAFARSMADRNAQAFAEFIADEAVFFAGTTPLRGKAKVIEGWAGYFADKEAPFSWAPDQVEVLASGTLALSTGLVRDPRRQDDRPLQLDLAPRGPNRWRVVFDKGGPPTPGPP